MASGKANPVIVVDVDTPEILASAIIAVADAAKKLLRGPLTRRTIALLIRDKTNIGMSDIDAVLNAASDLGTCLKKPLGK